MGSAGADKRSHSKEQTMQRRTFLQTSAALAVTASLPTIAPAAQQIPFPYPLTHAVTDASAPEVFFTKEISPAGLIKIYERLGQKRQGKVGVKVCFETPNGPHLDPNLVHAFADHVNGKLLDCTYYPPRDTVAKHLEVAKGNGFDTSRIDIIDAEGTVDLPIEGGKHLKFSRIGSHYNDYDTMIGLIRLKSHHIDFYGGMLKNLSIAIAPLQGKWLIHSVGRTDQSFVSSDDQPTTQAMADYVKGVMDAKKGRWVFLTVLDAVDPTDGCEGAKNLGNIGILASTDPVAIDQAAIDITFGAAATLELRREWEEHHSTFLTSNAEAVGVGKTHYRFTPID